MPGFVQTPSSPNIALLFASYWKTNGWIVRAPDHFGGWWRYRAYVGLATQTCCGWGRRMSVAVLLAPWSGLPISNGHAARHAGYCGRWNDGTNDEERVLGPPEAFCDAAPMWARKTLLISG